jgi:hypothetical protein
MRTLTIQLEDNDADGNDDEIIVERVLELIKQGFTRGYEPTWEIVEE